MYVLVLKLDVLNTSYGPSKLALKAGLILLVLCVCLLMRWERDQLMEWKRMEWNEN